MTTLLDGNETSAPSLHGPHLVLALAQHLARLWATPCVVALTRGVFASAAAQGSVWGIGRVLRLEHAALSMLSTDVQLGSLTAAPALFGSCWETETRWVNSCRCVARLRACAIAALGGVLERNGLHLVMGGLGGLGLCAAALLVKSGVRLVLLASRSGRMARETWGVEVELLPSLGAAAEVLTCDGAEASDMSALLCGRPAEGVLHLASAGDTGLLATLMADRVRSLCARKAVGFWHAWGVTAGTPQESCVLSSSAGSWLCNLGQASSEAAYAYSCGLAIAC